MPFYQGKSLCSKPEKTKTYLKNTKSKLCFDVNHAISSVLELKEDYLEFIKKFLELDIAHYHLGGQKIRDKDVTHLHFDESEIDLKEIFKILPSNAEITLEVGIDLERTVKDLKLVRSIIQKLNK